MKQKAYSYIRFSTLEQKKGDSLRRQMQGAEDWAKEHDYILDDRMKDEGLSAFKGDHKIKGSLGRFLKLVKAGKIEKESVLIVESMDRLSREPYLTAFDQLRELTKCGVRVVTLDPVGDYTEKNLSENIGGLMSAISDMDRAHRESSLKSKRLKSTWEAKRSNINNKVLTNRCPAWLKRSEDWKEYEKIKDRCLLIKKIFKLYLTGKSSFAIEKQLNQTRDNWKPQGRKKLSAGWRKSYVDKILRNPAVIGQYQPHKMIDGKRQPVGDSVSDYFPQVVPDDLFYAVQQKIAENRKGWRGGRTGKISNLFSYLAKCGYCGSAMHFINKGDGNSYLVCDRGKRKIDCKAITWRYDEFETDLLKLALVNVDVSSLLPDHEEAENEISNLQQKQLAIQGRLNIVESEIENLSETIATTSDIRVRKLLDEKLIHRLNEKETFQKQEAETEMKINDLEKRGIDIKERLSNLKELNEKMRDLKGKRLIDLRFKLRELLRSLIERIDVYPGGFKDRKHLNKLKSDKDERKFFAKGIDNKDFRFYEVHLKACKRSFKRSWYLPETYKKLEKLDKKREAKIVPFPM